MNPATAVKDLLVTAGVGTFGASTGWGIYINEMPTEPDTVIAVMDTPGGTPNPKYALDFPAVQCLMRGSPNGGQALITKAIEVKDALLGIFSQDLNGGRIVSITMQGDISGLGKDENGRPLRSLNLNMIIEPATLGNRIAL